MLNPPRIWLRKVDDTFVVTKQQPQELLNELNSIHQNIKFTLEEPKDNKLAFLDCEIQRNSENKLDIRVCKKPTHTGQYVHFTSNVSKSVKGSVINALVRRARLVSSTDEYFQEEMNYIKRTLKLNGYPEEFIKNETQKTLHNMNQINNNGPSSRDDEDKLQKMYIPYEKGTSEKIKRMAGKHRIKVIFTKGKRLKSILSTKKKSNVFKEEGIV